ncbi:MAG: 50S ribosomal protein L18 [Gammaproteobacteria bacterium WSBS_2016_MAG_OTU1]
MTMKSTGKSAGRPASERRRIRGAQTRRRQTILGAHRIVARMSGRHTYAQLVSPDGVVLAAACTPQKTLRDALGGKYSNVAAAESVGQALAKKIAALSSVGKLAFDRGGRKYHGRVKALAESLRASGLSF